MRVDDSAQTIFKPDSSSSYSGFGSWEDLGYGYLAAEDTRRQPLCGSKEGWGPLSPHRYDFTPCFMDACITFVATYGILFGAVAVWWLVKRKRRTEIEKDWHFWTKQVWKISV